jgi:phenylacetate-CoA ligase
MNLHAIVKKFPRPIKETLKAAYGAIPPRLRLGRTFWATYHFLQRSQWWDSGKLQDYQMQELEHLLGHCYENVPYYRRLFEERGLKPSDIQSPEDLRRLPYLRKEQIRRDPQAFLARNRRIDRLQLLDTSGTSGTPLQFYVDEDELQREWAFVCHQWSRVGYQPGDARANIRGRYISGAKPYEWDPILHVLRLSPVVSGKETATLYLELVRSYGLKFLCGYPSAISHFASLIRRHGLRTDLKLTAVLFASEALYPWQRTLVEDVFACRTYNFYGLAEHVAIAGECEVSHAFHCVPQYGITELDPQTGEIAGTGFLNHAHPFIRYKTTDVAALPAGSGCEKCGRHYWPVLPDIEGRLQDFIVTPEGLSISSCTLAFPFDGRKTISRVQIVQESLDRVILRTAPINEESPRLFSKELGLARNGLQRILGNNVTIKDERISPQECASAEKFRFIVSHLPTTCDAATRV